LFQDIQQMTEQGMTSLETPPHPSERIIGAIAGLLRNGERVATGTLSPLPAAATLLAKMTHAPDLEPLIYGDPELRLAEGFHELFALAQQGKIDVFFLSGVQIDREGNINLSVLGDYDRPAVRLPGGAGSSMLSALARRVILFTVNHNPRLFVPRVDFINATATDNVPWRRGGISHVVTPLGIMAFDAVGKRLVLEAVYTGVSLEEVARQTGFDLGIAGRDIPAVNPLRDNDLELLRGPVRRRMQEIYPLFTAALWGP
jgi:glutaconate CoA-transferase subunit B